MNNLIIGTAGHVDHGKTTLVEALTGVNTDFLIEERKRGISINLGFTHLKLPSGKIAGIVDVPGHEKFIRNMMSGVGGINIALLIIDASVGIMPQTIEHLDIIRYMGINKIIVVLTKSSLVSEDQISKIKNEVHDFLAKYQYDSAPIIPLDSITKFGLDNLLVSIDNIATTIDNSDKNLKPARIYTDRSFSKDGFGTIITGSLLEGSISVNDELMLYPHKTKVRVRSLQSYNKFINSSNCGQRLAINLSGINYKNIKRGDILSSDFNFISTDILNAHVTLSENIKLKNAQDIRFFFGNRELQGKIFILRKFDDYLFAQIRLNEPTYIKIYDHFIIRQLSPVTTIGGGVVLETNIRKMNKIDETYLNILESIYKTNINDYLHYYLQKNNIIWLEKLNTLFGNISEDNLANFKLCKNLLTTNEYFISCKNQLNKLLDDYIQENSHENDISLSKLESLINFNHNILDELLKLYKIDKDRLIIRSGVEMSQEDTKIYDDVISELSKTSFSNFVKYDDLAKSKKYKAILNNIYKEGLYVKLTENYIVSSKVFENAKDILINYLEKNSTIDVKTYKDLLNIGRKNAIILLETFDSLHITKRNGNIRTI